MPSVTKKYLHNINLAQNQLVNAVLEQRTTNPADAVDGQVYYNTILKRILVYKSDGTGWIEVGEQFVETDPVFTASPAASVTALKITNWDSAYGWGNHALMNYQTVSQKGQPNGYASLDGSGLVPAGQLPSYVDDVLEYNNLASFPAPGTAGKIYVSLDSNNTYRWSGSAYVLIGSSAVTSVNGNVGTVVITLDSIGGITLTSLSSFITGLNYNNTTGVFSMTSGYSIPTTASQALWDSAYSDRLKWDGGSSGLVAGTARTSLGATTVGSGLFTLPNPSAVMFLRINADNSVSTLDAAAFRTAIGATVSSGTVTAVAALTLGTTGTDLSSTVQNGTTTPVITLNIPTASSLNRGVLSASDWTLFNNKQATLTLTTTGTSGTATLAANTLNIPVYTLSGLGGQPLSTGLTSLSGLTYGTVSFVKMTAAGTFALDTTTYYLSSNPSGYTTNTGTVTSVAALTIGTSGTDITSTVANGTTTPVITLNIPTASALNRGALSAADWSVFNGKQAALNGTGFIRAVGTTISYDNSTYYLASNPSGYTANTGTVSTVSVTTANGISGTVATASSTPAITLTLGAITPTSVNTVVISGSATPALSVTGTVSVSGSNSGDNAVNTLYSGLVSNATHTGDATGSTALTVAGLRGVSLPLLDTTAGFLRYTGTGTNTWVFDTSAYITANQTVTVSGDATGSGSTAIALTLATVNSNIGTFNNVTVNAKGLVTAASTVAYLTGNQTVTLSGDVSGSGATAITTTIGANKVTNAMLAQVASSSFLGRVTAATGNVETLTGTQATTLLNVFSSTLKGVVPESGGGTVNYLRADGTWSTPAGTGGGGGGGTTVTDNITAATSLYLYYNTY